MTMLADRLRDVHAPARFVDGEIHWQMAAGPDAIDVSVHVAALHLLGPKPIPAYLEAFENHRSMLCDMASLKFGFNHSRSARVRIEREDILRLLEHGRPQVMSEEEHR